MPGRNETGRDIVTKSPTRPTGSSETPRKGGGGSKAAESKTDQGKVSENKAAAAPKADQGKASQPNAPQPIASQIKASQGKGTGTEATAAGPAATQASPRPQPSPAVTRNPERVARSKAGSAGALPQGGAGAQSLVVAGLVGGLLAGAAFIAYDLLLRPTPDTDTRLAAIEERVGELAGDVAQPGVPDDLSARLGALESQTEEALATAREAADRPVPDMPDVPVDAIEANTSAIEALRADITALQDSVSGLQAEVPMEGRIAAATRASAADYILGALSEGRPYRQALDVLRGQDVPEEALAPLEPFAEDGAPRLYMLAGSLAAELSGEDAPTAPTVTEREPGEGAGFLQLFVDRAITVERVDAPRRDVDMQSAQGVIAALEAGDAEAALNAWQALPAEVQAQGAGFGETLENLAAARAAALDIAQTALAALANGR